MKVSSSLILGLGATANACLTDREIEAEHEFALTGKWPSRPVESRDNVQTAAFPVSDSDRFSNGSTVPVGLGVDDRDLEAIMNPGEVRSALAGLQKEYPDDVELFSPPFETFEGRKFHGAVVGSDDPRVFIMSGIHARERGGPDNVIYFLADLLAARKDGTGVSWGGKNYTNEDVETALDAGIAVLPLTNPDGVAYDQETDSCWRKNRNTESSSGGSGRDVGIDLNRNYDFVWDVETAFAPEFANDAASDSPSSEIFHGTAAESEPETKAVVWALEQYKNISWFMDLHSVLGALLYGWGDDDVGTKDADQTFVNAEFDGKRGYTGQDPSGSEYKEYFTTDDLSVEKEYAEKMIAAMNEAGNVAYETYPAVDLYPTSGASNDWAMGRYYGKLACDSSRMFGLTLEFGHEGNAHPSCPFYPDADEFHHNVRQVAAGFMEMVLAAAGPAGEPLYPEC